MNYKNKDRSIIKPESAFLVTAKFNSEMLELWNSDKFNTLEEVGDYLRQNRKAGDYWSDNKINQRINYLRIKLGKDTSINDIMSNYKLETDKERLTTVDLEHINHVVIDLLSKDITRLDVVNIIQEYTRRGPVRCKDLVKKAIERMSDVTLRETNIFRTKRIKQLELDMSKAYKEYENCTLPSDRNKWFTTYLNIQARIDSYFPNGLQLQAPELSKAEQSININYEVIQPKKLVGNS